MDVYFDGDCPLCVREIAWLRRLDRHARLHLIDIASPDFEAPEGKTHETLMAEMHVRTADGKWRKGVDAFAAMYRAVGIIPIAMLLESKLLKPIAERAYAIFARNRLRWTGRDVCTNGTCAHKVPPNVAA